MRAVLVIAGVILLVAPRPAAGQSAMVRHTGDAVSAPVLSKQTRPTYPAGAGAAGIEGTVLIEAVISTNGRVVQPRVVRSPDASHVLDAAALAVVGEWQFRPATVSSGTGNTQPVDCVVRLQVPFALPNSSRQSDKVDPLVVTWPSPFPSPDDAFSGIRTPGAGIRPPTIKRNVTPNYTRAAMRAKKMGTVRLDVVVLPDGTVGAARISQSLDAVLGLDDEALATIGMWLFEPATFQGAPIPVRVTVELTFNVY